MEICRKKAGRTGTEVRTVKPYISLTLSTSVLGINSSALQLIGLKDGDAIMFGFDQEKQIGYIFKEEPQEDSYIIRVDQKNYIRFGNKNLCKTMVKIFQLKTQQNLIYFSLSLEPNKDNLWEFKKL